MWERMLENLHRTNSQKRGAWQRLRGRQESGAENGGDRRVGKDEGVPSGVQSSVLHLFFQRLCLWALLARLPMLAAHRTVF